MGDRREPVLAANISSTISLLILFFIMAERLKVRGTTIRMLISFVRNMEKIAVMEMSSRASVFSYLATFMSFLER